MNIRLTVSTELRKKRTPPWPNFCVTTMRKRNIEKSFRPIYLCAISWRRNIISLCSEGFCCDYIYLGVFCPSYLPTRWSARDRLTVTSLVALILNKKIWKRQKVCEKKIRKHVTCRYSHAGNEITSRHESSRLNYSTCLRAFHYPTMNCVIRFVLVL